MQSFVRKNTFHEPNFCQYFTHYFWNHFPRYRQRCLTKSYLITNFTWNAKLWNEGSPCKSPVPESNLQTSHSPTTATPAVSTNDANSPVAAPRRSIFTSLAAITRSARWQSELNYGLPATDVWSTGRLISGPSGDACAISPARWSRLITRDISTPLHYYAVLKNTRSLTPIDKDRSDTKLRYFEDHTATRINRQLNIKNKLWDRQKRASLITFLNY